MIPLRHALLVLPLLTLFAGSSSGQNWEETVTAGPPGSFPELRSLRANYRFAWSGITAGESEIRFSKDGSDRYLTETTAKSVGLARKLWKFDAKHSARSDATTLRPIEMHQIDTVRPKKTTTDLKFGPDGVISTRHIAQPSGEMGPPRIRQFKSPNIFDLQTAILYLRSQPLKEGDVHRIVVFPTRSAYLATVTVVGREKVSVPAGNYEAIKLDLQLRKVGKNRELEPHRKYRRGAIWISNDSDRLFLRAETQIFIGAVTAELKSVQFEQAQ